MKGGSLSIPLWPLALGGSSSEIEALIPRGGFLVLQSWLDNFKLILEDLFMHVCTPTEVNFWWRRIKNRFPDSELPPCRSIIAITKTTYRVPSLGELRGVVEEDHVDPAE